jgi:hypothetical protein
VLWLGAQKLTLMQRQMYVTATLDFFHPWHATCRGSKGVLHVQIYCGVVVKQVKESILNDGGISEKKTCSWIKNHSGM